MNKKDIDNHLVLNKIILYLGISSIIVFVITLFIYFSSFLNNNSIKNNNNNRQFISANSFNIHPTKPECTITLDS